MPKNVPQPDPEDAHTDLMATLAASRELGPEMDKALAESYMQKHKAALTQPQTPQDQQVALPSRFNTSDLASAIVMVAGIAAFTVAVVATGGHALGFFWLFFIFGGWRWFGWNRRNSEYRARRLEYRQAHREMRDDWRAMRRGYYSIGDPERPSFPMPPTPTVPQVSGPSAPQAAQVPQAPAQPRAAAPLPPVAPVAQAPATPPAPPASTPGTSSSVPPINPAG